MNCPNCSETLSERGTFCKACGAQARCIQCKELLELGAFACVECGAHVGKVVDGVNGTVTQPRPVVSEIPANRNTFNCHEDRSSRRFEASLTDSAMHGLGDVFGELFAQRGVGRAISPGGLRTFTKEVALDATKQLMPAEPEPPSPQANGAQKLSPEKERLLKIFTVAGEIIELAENRLKAKSAADYYKRLTYLFIYAQEILLGRSSAPKGELMAVLTAAKVNNGNCRFWLGKKNGFTVDSEDRMKLIAGAKEQAIKTIDEMLDSNVPDEWNPDTRIVKARAPRKKKA
jgi:hypothetical protein